MQLLQVATQQRMTHTASGDSDALLLRGCCPASNSNGASS